MMRRNVDDLDSFGNGHAIGQGIGEEQRACEADALARPRERAQRERVVRGVDADECDARQLQHQGAVTVAGGGTSDGGSIA